MLHSIDKYWNFISLLWDYVCSFVLCRINGILISFAYKTARKNYNINILFIL